MKDKNKAMDKGDNNQQNATISPATGLTPQQEQACILLASGESYTATAQRLNINRGTLYKWQLSLPFQCFYNQQCSNYKAEVRNAIFGLHALAVSTVKELINNGSEATRLKASVWLLEKIGAVEVGNTDVREILKERCYRQVHDNKLTVALSNDAYRRTLKEFGLNERADD